MKGAASYPPEKKTPSHTHARSTTAQRPSVSTARRGVVTTERGYIPPHRGPPPLANLCDSRYSFSSWERFQVFLLEMVAPMKEEAGEAYDLLGVERGVSREDLRSRYLLLVKKFHPDSRHHGDAARFDGVRRAFEEIGALEKHRAGDGDASAGIGPAQANELRPHPPSGIATDPDAADLPAAERGRAAFGQGSYELAASYFERAIAIEIELGSSAAPGGGGSGGAGAGITATTTAALYSNLSAARHAAGRFDDALAAADRCIAQDGTWAKAHFRRGSALLGLNELPRAR